MIVEILKNIIYTFIATWFFALVMHAPKKSLIYSSAIAAIGYVIYALFIKIKLDLLAFFIATFIIILLGEVCAKKIKMPLTIFAFPALVPIVPGYGLYQTMLKIVQNDIDAALTTGASTLLNLGAMTVAIALVSLIMRKPINNNDNSDYSINK